MNAQDWERLLSPWAADAVKRHGVDPRPGPLCGLGAPGASEAQIEAAEARLGCTLPPSYRQFLRCTNGLRQPVEFLAASGGDFWEVEKVDWFRVRNAEWVEIWSQDPALVGPGGVLVPHEREPVPDDVYFQYGPEQDPVYMRPEYLRDTLELSHGGDAAVYLLNPRVVGKDGEWEAWFFANWLPGATRYRSFAEMMLEHRERSRTADPVGF